jgi:hypothetical protein
MVSFDPGFFIPMSNERYQIEEFWEPYKNWERNQDVIILGKEHTDRRKLIRQDSAKYNATIQEREGYDKYRYQQGCCLLTGEMLLTSR